MYAVPIRLFDSDTDIDIESAGSAFHGLKGLGMSLEAKAKAESRNLCWGL